MLVTWLSTVVHAQVVLLLSPPGALAVGHPSDGSFVAYVFFVDGLIGASLGGIGYGLWRFVARRADRSRRLFG
jgi:hypothetical protein